MNNFSTLLYNRKLQYAVKVRVLNKIHSDYENKLNKNKLICRYSYIVT